MKRRSETGFSLIELMIVIAIGLVLTGMAIPLTINAVRSYRLSAAIAAAAGAVQSTRYAAIMHGYPGTGVPGYGYEITFTGNSYQVYDMVPPATTFSAVGSAVPIADGDGITVSRTVTYEFSAGGTVTETSNPTNMVFQITNSYGGSNTITVTGVGNVSVTSP